uniref:methylenetetrahydrofolate reductase n=1 Tax=Herbidospora sakaeratensis TaxID=564415 RepID=UPI000AB405BB|nr:methylenetetrahydrofolate reductase [Herbidospora sakaeratensis]
MHAISYEILPFRDAEESVLTHVPTTVPLTVTTTEAKGLGPTLDLAVRLRGSGYTVSPHLAARLVRDKQELTDIVARLKDAGVDGVFVVGGDAPHPVGTFPDALSLLEVLDATGHHFRRVGIAGYPEGHGTIGRDVIDRALALKTPYATHVITQMCFDARTTLAWARGVELPVVVGLPGAVTRQRLIRISAGLGLGPSARFLRKQQNLAARFFLPGGYRPDRLVAQLSPHVGGVVAGFHLFTFNELARTEAWRRSGVLD